MVREENLLDDSCFSKTVFPVASDSHTRSLKVSVLDLIRGICLFLRESYLTTNPVKHFPARVGSALSEKLSVLYLLHMNSLVHRCSRSATCHAVQPLYSFSLLCHIRSAAALPLTRVHPTHTFLYIVRERNSIYWLFVTGSNVFDLIGVLLLFSIRFIPWRRRVLPGCGMRMKRSHRTFNFTVLFMLYLSM